MSEEKNKYIVWYAYKGMETEGRLDLEQPISIYAVDKHEALYKYLCFRAFQSNTEPYHKSLTEHRASEYSDGGWGFAVRRLDDNEYCELHHFDGKYYHENWNR